MSTSAAVDGSTLPLSLLLHGRMNPFNATMAELDLIGIFLNKLDARDKMCRAIQFGAKFVGNGRPGTASEVEKSVSMARKTFRLFRYLSELHALFSPLPKGTPLLLILLAKSRNALVFTFVFLDQFVWAGQTGIYKNKEGARICSMLSRHCFLASSVLSVLIEFTQLRRLSKSMQLLEKELKPGEKSQDERYQIKLTKFNEMLLGFTKSAMNMVLAIGLLQLAPRTVTHRVTGALGVLSSLISCYQAFPSPVKAKMV